MTISLEEMKKSLSPDRLEKIEARALELEAERAAYLRAGRAWELTLKQLAEERGADPATIEGEAQRTDVILNTLKNFVAAASLLKCDRVFLNCRVPLEAISLNQCECA